MRILFDYLLILPKKDNFTSGGIALPDTYQSDHATFSRGTVVERGPGRYNNNGVLIPMNTNKNDIVLYITQNSILVTISGTNYILIREPDVVLVE